MTTMTLTESVRALQSATLAYRDAYTAYNTASAENARRIGAIDHDLIDEDYDAAADAVEQDTDVYALQTAHHEALLRFTSAYGDFLFAAGTDKAEVQTIVDSLMVNDQRRILYLGPILNACALTLASDA